jgi:hypothetical protein
MRNRGIARAAHASSTPHAIEAGVSLGRVGDDLRIKLDSGEMFIVDARNVEPEKKKAAEEEADEAEARSRVERRESRAGTCRNS